MRKFRLRQMKWYVRPLCVHLPFHIQLRGSTRKRPINVLLEPQIHPRVFVGEWFLLKLFFLFHGFAEFIRTRIIRMYYSSNLRVCVCVCVCVCARAKLLQSCLTLCDPVDCRPPGSSVHGILQARIVEWVAMLSSRRSFLSGD